MRSLVIVLASGLGTGYAPVASGTWGTLVGIPLLFLFAPLQSISIPLYLGVYVAAVAFACWIADHAEKIFDEHDSGKIVIDEIVGYLAATLFLPVTWQAIVAAFFVFRVLDIVKPYPAGLIDAKLPGGTGVVLDDVVSGLYSCLILHGVAYWGWLG